MEEEEEELEVDSEVDSVEVGADEWDEESREVAPTWSDAVSEK